MQTRALRLAILLYLPLDFTKNLQTEKVRTKHANTHASNITSHKMFSKKATDGTFINMYILYMYVVCCVESNFSFMPLFIIAKTNFLVFKHKMCTCYASKLFHHLSRVCNLLRSLCRLFRVPFLLFQLQVFFVENVEVRESVLVRT